MADAAFVTVSEKLRWLLLGFNFMQTEDSKKKFSCAERTTFRCSDNGQGTENLQDGSNLKLNALDYNKGIVKDTFDKLDIKDQHNIK